MTGTEPRTDHEVGYGLGRTLVASALVGVVLLVCVGVVMYLRHGSVRHAIAAARAESIVVDQEVRSVDAGGPVKVVGVSYALRNVSGERAAITGYRVSCECTTGERMPLVIEPGGVGNLRFEVETDGRGEGFTRSIVLITDRRDQPYVNLKIIGEAKP